MSDFDFQPYRDFILLDGDKQRALYTPTDALLPLQVGTIDRRELEIDGAKSSPERTVEQLPVLEGLRKYALGNQREHVILSGRPGSGKSTALQQLRLALAAEGLVPVLVQLKGDRSIPEMIRREFRRAKQKVSLEQIDDWLLADRLVVLLDGVNEIPTDDLRRGLAEFREQNATVPMIFTTRDLAIGGDFGIKQRLEMKPLTDLQMQKFIAKRLPVDGEKLLGQLGDRLREIAETPLLLKMLCDVFSKTGQIPENKGELFRLFDREYDKFKGLPAVSEDFRRFKSEILQQLAFVMMTGDSSKPTEFWLTIDQGVAEREIEMFLFDRVSDPAVKAKEWLEDLLEHHLLQLAMNGSYIEFCHQLFQEYYAAIKLLKILCYDDSSIIDDQNFCYFYLNHLKWTESLRFLLSLLDDENRTAQIVRQGLAIDYFLGASLAGAVKQQFQKQAVGLIDLLTNEQKLPEWLKIVLSEKAQSTFDRGNLVPSLYNEYLFITIQNTYQFSAEVTCDQLLEGIQEKQGCNCQKCIDIRCSAINKLGNIGNKTMIPLILTFLDDVDLNVRASVAKTVGMLGDNDNVPDLLPLLQDPDSYIRHTAKVAILNLHIEPFTLKEFNQQLKFSEYNEIAILILETQDKYKFYNYDVFCSPPTPPTTQPQNTPVINISGNVGNLNTGDVNIQGNQIGKIQ